MDDQLSTSEMKILFFNYFIIILENTPTKKKSEWKWHTPIQPLLKQACAGLLP